MGKIFLRKFKSVRLQCRVEHEILIIIVIIIFSSGTCHSIEIESFEVL